MLMINFFLCLFSEEVVSDTLNLGIMNIIRT